jgi:DNA topoisomerase-1
MSKNLVIVESPAKAKTIEKYLGKDFTVLSSIGHIRSIAKKGKGGSEAIDTKNGFETTYEVDPDKKKVITADTVWLATDEDREGEAIAWHLCEVLKLDQKTTKRIVFHEITESAIKEAVTNPRTIDMHLVAAQQARQILDRIVGFELSPVVWQKVPGGKSAGRVQSPAVRLLVEREREIQTFEGSYQFKITAVVRNKTEEFKAELPKRFDTEDEAKKYLETLLASSLTASAVTKSPGTRNPSAPFTTSTLQQDANAKLGFGSRATMTSAQKLYQDGKITYMRTDSMTLSSQAMASAASYIEQKYGKDYVQVRTFKTKSASAQEAHEAIRPTDMSLEKASSNEYDQKLYDLIRRRTLASQMAPTKLEKTEIVINLAGKDAAHSLVAKGEIIVFPGFLAVYGGGKDDTILPNVSVGDTLDLASAEARQVFARPPARYTEGSLVKKLEELGIGRPSTYATIINTVQTRGYVERGEGEGEERDVIILATLDKNAIERSVVTEKTGANKGKLVPTPSGELIADFLTDHFEPVVDYGFTASVEEHFDEIANDKLERNKMLSEFYGPFHELIAKSGEIDRSTVGASREVGVDPKTGKPIIARFGRFGPMLQLGATESDDKPEFAPMPKGAKIESVTLEQALEAFKLPRIVGQTEDGQDIKANIGRFGPYIQIDKLYVSIKPLDPHTINLEEARELYAAKLKSEAEKNISDFGDGIKVLNGRFGPYITDGKKNAKIPKDTEPKSITHEQAKTLLAEAPDAKRRRFTRKPKK